MFRPLLLEHFRTMVRLGLARSRVQPFLEKNQSMVVCRWSFAGSCQRLPTND